MPHVLGRHSAEQKVKTMTFSNNSVSKSMGGATASIDSPAPQRSDIAPPGGKCWLSTGAASLILYRRLFTEAIADAERVQDDRKVHDLSAECMHYARWLRQHVERCDECSTLFCKPIDGGCSK
jgi:hypothetical protein